MADRIIMPKQGLQMTEGTIIKWLIPEGGPVVQDEPLFEMETDKLTITVDASASGTLLKIIRGEGETVPITETIAIVGRPREDIASLLKSESEEKAYEKPEKSKKGKSLTESEMEKGEKTNNETAVASSDNRFATPRAKKTAGEHGIDWRTITASGPDGLVIERDVLAAVKLVKATGVAKMEALNRGIPLQDISGTGTGGKIMKQDVLRAVEQAPAAAGKYNKPKIIPLTKMRQVIAKRMHDSLMNTAQANHRISVDMTEAVRWREGLQRAGTKVSFNDLVIKVVTRALMEYPEMNSSMVEEGLLYHDYVNMGIAVALENGLIVPVVKNTEAMTTEGIAAASRDVIARAKAGELKPDEYTGGTFTISNLGMYDIDHFTAILNPPEVGILALGKIAETPVAREPGRIETCPLMVLTLTYDHRAVDGAPAAMFLQRIKTLLQNPYLLI